MVHLLGKRWGILVLSLRQLLAPPRVATFVPPRREKVEHDGAWHQGHLRAWRLCDDARDWMTEVRWTQPRERGQAPTTGWSRPTQSIDGTRLHSDDGSAEDIHQGLLRVTLPDGRDQAASPRVEFVAIRMGYGESAAIGVSLSGG
jgi:hypothetical protein